MKIQKILQNIFKPKRLESIKKSIPPCPIVYDPKNVTADEYGEFVRWLSENNINKTFYEPDRFVTEAEREVSKERKAELDEFNKFVKYLAENDMNRTFMC